MARLFKLKELEERRKALATESELYRQMLYLEVQNLRLYGARVRRQYGFLSPSNPLVGLLTPYVGRWFMRRRQRIALPKLRWLSLLIGGWRMYRRFSPLIRMFVGRRSAAPEPERPTQQERMQSIL